MPACTGSAQQAIAARDQFLSIASHELRAPLARLKSHAEVVLQTHSQGQLDQERLAWSLQRINAAVDRLASLTKDVRDHLERARADRVRDDGPGSDVAPSCSSSASSSSTMRSARGWRG